MAFDELDEKIKNFCETFITDTFGDDGYHPMTRAEILDVYKAGLRLIYGEDINLDTNTQDGQRCEINTQLFIDIREKIVEFNNSINPDNVTGLMQDIRYQINNCFRKGGTFTVIPVTLSVTAPIQLQGLDDNYNDILASAYGRTDESGNIYYLIDSVELEAGIHTLNFRPAIIGAVVPALGTITNSVQVYPQITSSSNDEAPSSIGEVQETDEDYRIRRNQSVAINGQNSANAMQAQILQLAGVNTAKVYENNETGTNDIGMPSHSIWAVVEGGSQNDIADVIYTNSAGASMIGATIVPIVNAAGQTINIKFDRSTPEPLWLSFNILINNTTAILDFDPIKTYIIENAGFEINQPVSTEELTELAREATASAGINGKVVNVQISNNGMIYGSYFSNSAPNNIWQLSQDDIAITTTVV